MTNKQLQEKLSKLPDELEVFIAGEQYPHKVVLTKPAHLLQAKGFVSYMNRVKRKDTITIDCILIS